MGRTLERVGVFGGTFDPIHIGHLAIASAVVDALSLDRILFVVAHQPWQKTSKRRVSDSLLRLEMVEAATAHRCDMVASAIEIERGGKTYSIDTIEALEQQNPADYWLVVGSDVLGGLTTWHRWQDLAEKAKLAVVKRPGSEHVAVPYGWRYEHIDTPQVNISSTMLRQRLSEGKSVRYLVPDSVLAKTEIIDELYRS